MGKHWLSKLMGIFLLFVMLTGILAFSPNPMPVKADGFIGFEDGVDGYAIRDSIPGLHFTNTNGYDWIYGDWRTGNYNGKYPPRGYFSNGDFFGWLGSTQGDGRIDFTQGDAHYFSAYFSASVAVTVIGFNSFDIPIALQAITPNYDTGRMDNVTLNAPFGMTFSYVIISGIANYWLVDDISTDAGGVPNERVPIILLPGIAGSRLKNDSNQDGNYDEVWPNFLSLAFSDDDAFLWVARLKPDGETPLYNTPDYTTVTVGDIILKEVKDFYKPTVDYLVNDRKYELGKTLILCPYDWRKDITQLANGTTLDHTLDKCIDEALAANPTANKVNILAHSMGGLLARSYISDPIRAAKVNTLITLGTPYLGAPKIGQYILDNTGCFIDPGGPCLSNENTIHEILQNFPGAYELSPTNDFFSVYKDGYIRIDWDANKDGKPDNTYLNQSQTADLYRLHNLNLENQALNLAEQSKGGWSTGQNNGVKVVMIVGDQQWTIQNLVQYEDSPWWDPNQKTIKYKVEKVESGGDGTVPLHSADLRNYAAGVDLSGSAFVFYFKSDHSALPTQAGVYKLAADIFASSSNTTSAYQYIKPAKQTVKQTNLSHLQTLLRPGALDSKLQVADETPRTEPLPLNGRLISIEGPVDVRITNSLGNVIGLNANKTFNENQIEGANLEHVGSTTYVFVPSEDTYKVEILGNQNANADVRIQNITSDQLISTTLYENLPLTERSTAFLNYNPANSNPGSFLLDQDGNNEFEDSSQPPVILDPTQSQDTIAPEASIQLVGSKTIGGWYVGNVQVTLLAVDNEGGSGVAKIEYSLDGGNTIQIYNHPFTVEASQVTRIIAKATDIAGNEQGVFTLAQVSPYLTRLPFVLH